MSKCHLNSILLVLRNLIVKFCVNIVFFPLIFMLFLDEVFWFLVLLKFFVNKMTLC